MQAQRSCPSPFQYSIPVSIAPFHSTDSRHPNLLNSVLLNKCPNTGNTSKQVQVQTRQAFLKTVTNMLRGVIKFQVIYYGNVYIVFIHERS